MAHLSNQGWTHIQIQNVLQYHKNQPFSAAQTSYSSLVSYYYTLVLREPMGTDKLSSTFPPVFIKSYIFSMPLLWLLSASFWFLACLILRYLEVLCSSKTFSEFHQATQFFITEENFTQPLLQCPPKSCVLCSIMNTTSWTKSRNSAILMAQELKDSKVLCKERKTLQK
jgi:hypothetical protein